MELGVLSSGTWKERMLGQSPWEWAGFSQEEEMAEPVSGGGHSKSKGSEAGEGAEWEEQ